MSKVTATDAEIIAYRKTIMEGYMLCIDPSAGSGSSMPGYAIYHKGKQTESGIIKIDSHLPKNRRLFAIRQSLVQEFEVPDILVIEHISPRVFRGGQMNSVSLAGLHRAVGAILSAFDDVPVIEIPPAVWKSTVDDSYSKTDESDAIYIGRYALLCAAGQKFVQAARDARPKTGEGARQTRVIKAKKPRKKKASGPRKNTRVTREPDELL